MAADALLERLQQHRLLGDAPVYELRYLAEHGQFKHTPKGDFYIRKGEPPDSLWIVLSGRLAIYVDRGLGPRRVLEWHGGDASGAMPYSRIGVSPGDVIALEPSDLLLVNRSYFPDLTRECPTVTTKLVHVMIDRTRTFNSSERQDEKMIALGRIAAGLAHELNNPASAVKRSAQQLAGLIDQAESSTRVLAAANLSAAQLDAMDQARVVCGFATGELTPLDRADREEALDDCLVAHNADSTLAGALLDTGATPDSLNRLHTAIPGAAFDAAARWIAVCCSIRILTNEIMTASTRMHELVSVIKRSSYMDQAQVPEALDLAQGLRDSVSILQHKARARSVTLNLTLQPGLPRVLAIGSDLNQAWSNLVDNALDAAPSPGHVDVSATAERGGVIVRVVDDGPGIPDNIREKIFDAFFTTKGPGKGTGLGLEMTRRLVFRNGGDIEVDSAPGRTEFRVLLKKAPEQS
ncbi:MAG: ATP-binding protein [Vicinamibacterales bacterium]